MIEHTPRLRELTPPQPCSLFRVGRCHIISRIYTRRAHHVENARSEAEQQKHDHSPRGNSKPSIDEPADRCTDKNAGHQFRRQPKAPRHCRRIGARPLSGAVFRPFARLRVSKLFAETFESRRERSVTIRWLPAALPFARVAGHALRHSRKCRKLSNASQDRRTILDRVSPSQESAHCGKSLELKSNQHASQPPNRRCAVTRRVR